MLSYLEGDGDERTAADRQLELLDGAFLVERQVELARVPDRDPVEERAVLGLVEVLAQLRGQGGRASWERAEASSVMGAWAETFRVGREKGDQGGRPRG